MTNEQVISLIGAPQRLKINLSSLSSTQTNCKRL